MPLYNTKEYWEGKTVPVILWLPKFQRRKFERKLYNVEPLGDLNFSWQADIRYEGRTVIVKRGRGLKNMPLDCPDAWTGEVE